MGATSFFSDTGHEMVTSVLPSFVTATLGGSAAALGLIDGVSDACAGIAKVAAGPVADDPTRRRRIATGGYTVTAVATALIGLTTMVWQVAALRVIAWTARGGRSPARDAMLSSIAGGGAYGRAFGIERAGDNLGAVVGPLVAAVLVSWWDIRPTMLISFVPGVLATVAITVAARAARRLHGDLGRFRARLDVAGLRASGLPRQLLPVVLFECGNLATTLLILRATDAFGSWGVAGAASVAIVVYAAHNAAAALVALGGGSWLDRTAPRRVFATGAAVYVVAYGLLATDAAGPVGLVVGFVLAGCGIGLAETAESALVAGILPDRLRGSGYGLLGGIQAAGDIVATVVAGILYTLFGAMVAFAYAALWMLLAVAASTLIRPPRREPAPTTPATEPMPGGAPTQKETAMPDHSQVTVFSVAARQILDSRGYPTVAVRLTLDDGAIVDASAPAGASTGEFEAVELRDGGDAFSGRGVRKAVASVTGELAELLTSRPWATLHDLDAAMSDLDGTENLARLGANAVVAVSIAAARAFAHAAGMSVHGWLSQLTGNAERLPVPHFNVLNGGAHAANPLDFQEFMVAPVGAASEEEAVQTGAEVYHALAARVKQRFGTAGLGDEGGFAPNLANPRDALDLLVSAIQDAGAVAAVDQVAIAIDPAANGFYEGEGHYRVDGTVLDREALVDYYEKLLDHYPVRSIEDGFAEDDHEGWRLMFGAVGRRTQLVGDDLYVTDARRIEEGALSHWSNAVLIKPNQIGTVTGTLDAIAVAREHNMQCMVSHRSGETTDDFIADLVVGTGVGQIKSGAPARGERVVKYNRLMAIEAGTPGTPYGLAEGAAR